MRAGVSILLLVAAVFIVVASHMSQQAEVVSCDQVLQQCTSQTYPVTPETP